MDKKITVAANYLDRDDKEFRYLIVPPAEACKEPEKVKELHLKDVTFKQASPLMQMFGCQTSASGTRMTEVPPTAKTEPTKMRFVKGMFLKDTGNEPHPDDLIENADYVSLLPDGQMLAHNPR